MKMRYCSDDALRTGKQIVNLNKNNTSENVASNENTIIIIIIELVLLRHNFSAVSTVQFYLLHQLFWWCSMKENAAFRPWFKYHDGMKLWLS